MGIIREETSRPGWYFLVEWTPKDGKPKDLHTLSIVHVIYHDGSEDVGIRADKVAWSRVDRFMVINHFSIARPHAGIADPVVPQATPENAKKYNHYFVRVPFTHIDVYRLLELFKVTDNAIGHAIKKLLVPGLRGGKPTKQDIIEARDTLNRRIEMWDEDEATKDDML